MSRVDRHPCDADARETLGIRGQGGIRRHGTGLLVRQATQRVWFRSVAQRR